MIFLDIIILILTRSTDISVHRAGSQLKNIDAIISEKKLFLAVCIVRGESGGVRREYSAVATPWQFLLFAL